MLISLVGTSHRVNFKKLFHNFLCTGIFSQLTGPAEGHKKTVMCGNTHTSILYLYFSDSTDDFGFVSIDEKSMFPVLDQGGYFSGFQSMVCA